MVDCEDSIFHKIYDFESWMYSDWFLTWEKLASQNNNYNN